jgi:hypothetical protein
MVYRQKSQQFDKWLAFLAAGKQAKFGQEYNRLSCFTGYLH